MEMMAGVWEFVTLLMTTRRGFRWLVLGLVALSAVAAALGLA